MPFLRISAASWRPEPWANGAGITHELFRHGDPFDVRLSVAIVEADGPFSVLPGVDRTIAMLTGAGFRLLDRSGRAHTISEIGAPHSFSGDEPMICSLLAGPVLDWNLMVRRTARPFRVERVVAGVPRVLHAFAVFAVDGGAMLDRQPLHAHDLALPDGPALLEGRGQRLLAVLAGP